MDGANLILSQAVHMVPLIDPIADAFDTGKTTTPINCRDISAVTFYLYWGVGATGTQTVTVEACDDTSATTTSALPFKYRIRTATDVFGALVDATTAGFTTTAGSSQVYVIEVNCAAMGHVGYKYLRLKTVEVVNSPVLGGVWAMCQVSKPRAITSTVIT